MAERLREWCRRWSGAVWLLLGYGLCKALTLDSYVTAFGTVRDPVGYVSTLPFMIGANVSTLLTAVAVLLWCRGRRRLFALPYRVPLVLLVGAYALGYLFADHAPWAMVALGLLWGCATRLVSVSFIELFSHERSSVAVILQLVGALVLSATFTLGLRNAPEALRLLAWPLIAVVCWWVVRRGRSVQAAWLAANAPFAPNEGSAPSSAAFKDAVKMASLPVMAFVFFELVIGLINMFAYFGGSTFVIASSAPMWGMIICGVLLVLFVVVTNKTPDPDTSILVAFPVAIAVFLLLPLVGGSFGAPLSVLIYTAYTFTTTLCTFCYIRACFRYRADIYSMSFLVSLVSRVLLLLGYAMGYACAQIPDSEPLVRTGVMVAVCVYMLLFVTVVWHYRTMRRAAKPKVIKVVQTFEEANSARLDAIMALYGLTGRERDVYASLLKGGTAKSIAAELGISPYTVQDYIRGLYGKLGVNKKEQAVELFYAFDETGEKPSSAR